MARAVTASPIDDDALVRAVAARLASGAEVTPSIARSHRFVGLLRAGSASQAPACLLAPEIRHFVMAITVAASSR